MKYILLVVALISLSTLSSLNLERHRRTKDGSGSYDLGFTCPGLSITLRSSDSDNREEILYDVFFLPKNINTPSVPADSLGWAFKLSAAENKEPSAEVAGKVLIKSGDWYYLPYRFFSQEISLNTPISSNIILTAILTNDEKEVFNLKLVFPYGYYKTFASVVDVNVIRSDLSNRVTDVITQILIAKKEINQASGIYIANKPLLTSYNESKEKFDIQKKKDLDRVNVLKDELVIDVKKKEELELKISSLKSLISDTEGKRDRLRENANLLTSSNNAITEELLKLEGTTTTDINTKKGTYLSNYEKALKEINVRLGNMKPSCPGRDQWFKDFPNTVMALNNDGVNKQLNLIYPTS